MVKGFRFFNEVKTATYQQDKNDEFSSFGNTFGNGDQKIKKGRVTGVDLRVGVAYYPNHPSFSVDNSLITSLGNQIGKYPT